MKISKITLAVAAALFSSTAMADSWEITQTADFATATTITQSGANDASVQAINAINAADTSITANSAQTVTIGGTNSLTLSQGDTTSSSTQAANYTVANDIVADFTQSLPGTGATTLNQTASGDDNTQGLNMVVTGGIGATLTQSSLSEDVDMNQGVGANNTGARTMQVGNSLVTTGTVDAVDQDLGAGGTLTMTQETTGANSTQAGNLIDASDVGATITAANQDITTTGGVGSFTLSQDGTTSALQVGNGVIVDGATNLNTHVVAQAVSAETLAQVQQDTTTSWQADNYVGPALP